MRVRSILYSACNFFTGQTIMRRPLLFFLALTLALPSFVQAQVSVEWDPVRLQVTRDDLTELRSRYEAVVESSAYSGAYREDARRAAARITDRLENGDFRTGDRIFLEVEGELTLPPDTVFVEPGSVINLPEMEPISLQGVLRAELRDHLEAEISRYIRNPVVRAYGLIRLQMQGGIGQLGFFVFPADMLLSDALMAAGGPTPGAKMDDIKLQRGALVLMEGAEVSQALQDGRSLDQLNLRAGDVVLIEEEQQGSSQIWGNVIRWGAIITSSLLLGIRIF